MSVTLQALEATRDRLAHLREQTNAELERRTQQIVALVDDGEDRKQIASAGGVSQKSICIALKAAG